MNITEQDFYRYIPSATNPEGYGIFDMVQDDIKVASAVASSLLGPDLFNNVSASADDETNDLFIYVEPVKRYICLFAYDRAIPSLDLVLTPTGFGVVSNQNVAPASADRVERLRRSVKKDLDNALDCLLDALRSVESWRDTVVAKRYFSSLIWRGSMAKNFGYPNEGRTKLLEISADIAEFERRLIHLISPELHAELIDGVRRNSATPQQLVIIQLCEKFIYSCYTRRKSDVIAARNSLLLCLDQLIEFFPTYRASSSYTANHYEPYENKKDDTCYFFG